jgi:hypothetical protein
MSPRQRHGPIRCFVGRAAGRPCEEPAIREMLDPAPRLLCEHHARQDIEEEGSEDWTETHGAERYARLCEEAANSLYRWMRDERQNEVTHYVLEDALTHLEIHELKRARSALEETGGTPRLTEGSSPCWRSSGSALGNTAGRKDPAG